METPKQKEIREAYGKYWENVRVHLDSNGWCSTRRHIDYAKIANNLELETQGYIFRPKSLSGIENNRGWIKIESEDDLPKEEGNYWIKNSFNQICVISSFDNFNPIDKPSHWLQNYSYYQPIQKPEPPIY